MVLTLYFASYPTISLFVYKYTGSTSIKFSITYSVCTTTVVVYTSNGRLMRLNSFVFGSKGVIFQITRLASEFGLLLPGAKSDRISEEWLTQVVPDFANWRFGQATLILERQDCSACHV